jgi:hypothetical protein
LRRKSEGHFPFSVVVDDVGAAAGLQKKMLDGSERAGISALG